MAFDTWQENSGGASFLPAGCVEWGQGCCGSAGEGPHLTVRSERTQQLLLGEECPATSGAAAAAWDSLTLNRQSQILFSTLSCQILTPTQEKGSTFCQMLRPLPLQNAPANLSLRRMRGPTRLPDCARWASGSRLLLGLGPSSFVGRWGLSLIQIWTLEPDLAGAPPAAQPPRGFLSRLPAHSLHTASCPSVSPPVCSSP